MKYRPSVPFLLCLLGIAVVEIEVVRTMGLGPPALEYVSADQATLDYLEKRQQPIHWNVSEEQITATATAAEEAKRKLLAEFPGLAFQGGTEPDPRNAYDPIRRGTERRRETARRMQSGPSSGSRQNRPLATLATPRQPGAFNDLLTKPEYKDVLAKIEHLTSLQLPSSAEEARERFKGLSQRGGYDCISALLNKADLVANGKDDPGALRIVEAAIRLSSHFDAMEDPIESEFVGARRELIRDMSLRAILHRIGPGADLSRWREVLATIPAPIAPAWSAKMREAWHDHADRVIAASLDPINSEHVAALATDLHRFSANWGKSIALMEEGSPGILLIRSVPPPKRYKDVQGFVRLRSLGNGYPYYLASRIRTLTALDLLILEKSGTTLEASSLDQIATGLLASEVPRFDPAKRQLSFTPFIEDGIRITPVKLPW